MTQQTEKHAHLIEFVFATQKLHQWTNFGAMFRPKTAAGEIQQTKHGICVMVD